MHTSKGRKMDQAAVKTGTEIIEKTFRGNKVKATKTFYDFTFTTDYGVTIKTKGYVFYPSTAYYLPDGSTTSNKWDLYELYKKGVDCSTSYNGQQVQAVNYGCVC